MEWLKNHGAATVSTKASWSSLSHTNADHNGWSAALCLPTQTHLTKIVTVTAIMPAAISTRPESSQVRQRQTELRKTTLVLRTDTRRQEDTAEVISRRVT